MNDNGTAYFRNKVATWFENMCGDIEGLPIWKQKSKIFNKHSSGYMVNPKLNVKWHLGHYKRCHDTKISVAGTSFTVLLKLVFSY